MRDSFRDLGDPGKAAHRRNLGQGVSEIPAKVGHPLSDDELRSQTADACRRVIYGVGPHVAGDLDRDASLIYKWTNGERRSPAESVAIITRRSLAEAKQPRENSIAIVAWLARVFLTADELENLAARKRTESEGSARALRIAARGIESTTDEIAAHGPGDVLAVRRELRRARRALDEIEMVMDRAVTAHKVEAPRRVTGGAS